VGAATSDLDAILERYIYKSKALAAFKTIPGYSHASCISINHEAVHGIPSNKKIIRNGDIVKIDVGIAYRGFFSDACSTFQAGTITDDAKRLVVCAREALMFGIDRARVGNRLGDIGEAIQSSAESYGYAIVRAFTGHGIGFALHESPLVPHFGKGGSGILLREGMVLAIEPILNQGTPDVHKLEDGWTHVTSDGMLSAQFEHTIAITSSGPSILTL
jgi:methionyl aminopeptidase